jgi:hypothetical protein
MASYNQNTDYMALMKQSADQGNYQDAARYEQQRNAKIDDMNANNANPNNYTKTYDYQKYLDPLYQGNSSGGSSGGSSSGGNSGYVADNTDYQALINQAVKAGNYAAAAQYELQRNAKIDSMNANNANPNGYTKTYLYQNYLKPTSSGSTAETAPVAPITPTPIVTGQSSLVRPSQSENRLTADDIKAMYDQMSTQQQEKIDYTVQQAVDELTRAQEDAQKGFAEQQNQVNLNEAQSRDAQVLYAAARGDRGGITARQYDSISNTAANNRAAIAQAQQQLATDTARQIADLRAQGEFEKADALLQIAQQQLAQLWELQQYNDNLLLQEQQLAMQESQLTGQYNGAPTIDVQLADREFNYNTQLAEREWQQAVKEWDYATAQQEREWAYEIAMQSIQAGIVPDASTLAAAGIGTDTASQMASIYRAANTKTTTGGGSTTATTTKAPSVNDAIYKNAATMYENGATDEEIKAYLVAASPDLATAKTYAGFLGLSNLWPAADTTENPSGNPAPISGTPTTREEAVSVLQDAGVSSTLISGAMSRTQWENKKKTYEKTGRGGGTEVTHYNTYEEYLSAYVEYCLSHSAG